MSLTIASSLQRLLLPGEPRVAEPAMTSQRESVSDWLAVTAGEASYHSCNRVREYATRPESGSLIDHVIVRQTDDVTDVRVSPCSWSDHDLVVAEIAMRRERNRQTEIRVRSRRNLDLS